ncbi:protein FAM185A [Tachyglossus aculeatus]|uniref:protein FAM185A n=1 Tax=Tachyglossus aculeatus TaxID=9261 RepID=UPI0018F2BD77|nr:protein FAM185A [Tachyglossus aculeatus]
MRLQVGFAYSQFNLNLGIFEFSRIFASKKSMTTSLIPGTSLWDQTFQESSSLYIDTGADITFPLPARVRMMLASGNPTTILTLGNAASGDWSSGTAPGRLSQSAARSAALLPPLPTHASPGGARLPGICSSAGAAARSRDGAGNYVSRRPPRREAPLRRTMLGAGRAWWAGVRRLGGGALVVDPFGGLRAHLPCHVTVRPLDPTRGDRLLLLTVREDGDRNRKCAREREQGLDGLVVRHDEARRLVTLHAPMAGEGASLDVQAPLKFDLDIKTSGTGRIKVQKAEGDHLNIETEWGDSILESIKSHRIHVRTKGGTVTCLGTIHGNTDIFAAEKSSVSVDKMQGSSVNISTEEGPLKVRYLYTDSSLLSSVSGDITLGSIHGDTTLQSQTGNIIVASSAGRLRAFTRQGAIDAYVSQVGKVALKSQKGSIVVKVPSSLQAGVRLSGSKVDVKPEIQLQEMSQVFRDDGVLITGHMNQTTDNDKWIKAEAPNGTVTLESQSWFQSLKLSSG